MRARRASARAFTLVELLVVLAIIALLISILLPVLQKARDEAVKITCRSKLRQLVIAVRMYADQYKGFLPGPMSICDPPGPETTPTSTGWLYKTGLIKDPRIWFCPADPRVGKIAQFSFTYNGRMIVVPGYDEKDDPPILDYPYVRKITTFREPSRCIVYAEENTQSIRPYPINDAFFIYYDVTDNRHRGMSEVGYLDGHAGEIPPNIALWSNRKYYPR